MTKCYIYSCLGLFFNTLNIESREKMGLVCLHLIYRVLEKYVVKCNL